jgi:hypothetical protein
MPKSFARRSKSNLERRGQRQMVSRKRLHQAGLAVRAGSEHRALHGVHAPAPQNHVDRAVHFRIFPGRRSRLYRIRHCGELAFLLLLGQGTNLLFKMFFCRRHRFHDLAI